MATIHNEISIARSKDFVWNAIRDVGAIHQRLVRGFVTDCKLEGDSRIVTFANGMVVRELLVDVDDERCRHSWAARSESLAHHNASAQVFADGEHGCRVVWIADVMPHEAAKSMGEMIQLGLKLAQMAGVRAAKKMFAKMVPGAGIVLGTWANSSSTKDLARRAVLAYRKPQQHQLPR